MGWSEEDVSRILEDADGGESHGGEIEIWPENVETVSLFFSCQTQWRAAPMGGVLGLDYPGVAAALAMLRAKDRPRLFAGLQVMERAALSVLTGR